MNEISTHDKILQTASDMFAQQGYSAISMRDVAAAVKVTPANLYYHFKDKEHLILETLSYVFSERMKPMSDILSASTSTSERMENFVRWFTQLLFEDTTFARLMCRELLDGDKVRLQKLVHTVFEKPFKLLSDVAVFDSTTADPTLSAISVISVILGHYQLSAPLQGVFVAELSSNTHEQISTHILSLMKPLLVKNS